MKEKNEVKFNPGAVLALLVLWISASISIGILCYDLFVNNVAFASHGSHWFLAFNIVMTIILTFTFRMANKEADPIET